MHIIKSLFIISIAFFCISCSCSDEGMTTYTAKEFLFNNQNIKIKIDDGDWLDKYTSIDVLKRSYYSQVMTIRIDNQYYEILLSEDPKRIGDTNFYVFNCSG